MHPHVVHDLFILCHALSNWVCVSFVSQVAVVRPIGSTIRSYLASKVLLEKLRSARARVKMYSPDTPFSKGANPKLREKMLQKVDKLFYKTEQVVRRLVVLCVIVVVVGTVWRRGGRVVAPVTLRCSVQCEQAFVPLSSSFLVTSSWLGFWPGSIPPVVANARPRTHELVGLGYFLQLF